MHGHTRLYVDPRDDYKRQMIAYEPVIDCEDEDEADEIEDEYLALGYHVLRVEL